MNILITGGMGFIGSELARRLTSQGKNVILFDVNPNYSRNNEIKDSVKVVIGDLSNWPEVMNVVKDNAIDGVYHFGSMLSIPSDNNPWASFQVNVCGTVNVLEAARLFGVKEVVFSSSLASYGLGINQIVTDETLQRPTTMYGCGKVYCELLGSFYRRKFGLDFRSIRFPSIVGPGVRTPGISQFTSWMIEHAIQGKTYECYVDEETKAPVIYYKDAVRCSEMLFDAKREQIKTVNYNISGVSPTSAKELETTINKYIEAKVTYKPDSEIMKVQKSLNIEVIDDSNAKQEWGWEPIYDSFNKIVPDFINEMRLNPHRYSA